VRVQVPPGALIINHLKRSQLRSLFGLTKFANNLQALCLMTLIALFFAKIFRKVKELLSLKLQFPFQKY